MQLNESIPVHVRKLSDIFLQKAMEKNPAPLCPSSGPKWAKKAEYWGGHKGGSFYQVVLNSQRLFLPSITIVVFQGKSPPQAPPQRNCGGQMARQKSHLEGGTQFQTPAINLRPQRSSLVTLLSLW